MKIAFAPITDQELLEHPYLSARIANCVGDFVSNKVAGRTLNGLKLDDIVFIAELASRTETEMLRIPRLGSICIDQLKRFTLSPSGVRLGMDFSYPPHLARPQQKSWVRRACERSELIRLAAGVEIGHRYRGAARPNRSEVIASARKNLRPVFKRATSAQLLSTPK